MSVFYSSPETTTIYGRLYLRLRLRVCVAVHHHKLNDTVARSDRVHIEHAVLALETQDNAFINQITVVLARADQFWMCFKVTPSRMDT